MTPSASDVLAKKSEEVMLRWQSRVDDEIVAAQHLESVALRDSLPVLLSLIVEILAGTTSRTEARKRWEDGKATQVSKKHGHERANLHNYSVSQMVSEYHILRQVVCDVIEEEHSLTSVEREVIVCAIEAAVADASTHFNASIKKTRERLTATITHDLRGPLTVASLATERILQRPNDAQHCIRFTNRIASSLSRLELMLRSLLDVSLLEDGKELSLCRETFAISPMIRQVADDFNLLHDNRLVFTSCVSGNVFWDKAEIYRLLDNLTTNAIKYGTKKTPITVALDEETENVTLCVHNEGPAISPADQSAIFGHFGRGKASHEQKGWGLGLSIVKGIVHAHNGVVKVESSQEAGTNFVVILPKNLHFAKDHRKF